jgi:hypothetical protein
LDQYYQHLSREAEPHDFAVSEDNRSTQEEITVNVPQPTEARKDKKDA